jgi:hypothetical protein
LGLGFLENTCKRSIRPLASELNSRQIPGEMRNVALPEDESMRTGNGSIPSVRIADVAGSSLNLQRVREGLICRALDERGVD